MALKSEGRGHNLEHQQSLAANSDLQVVPFLPYDIVESMLPRLPVRSLVRFRCVCRHWMALIDDPNFIMLHYKIAKDKPRVLLHKFVVVPATIKYYELGSTAEGPHVNDADEAVLQEVSFQVSIKDNTVRNNVLTRWCLSNSMHGLVCVFVGTETNNNVYLMNPTTRETAKLPKRPLQTNFGISSFLLGFNAKRGEYMVAWMYSNPMSQCTRWDVLTLGRNPFGSSEEPAAKWKYVGQQVGTEICDHGETIHVDGMFYWLSQPGCADKFFTVDARGEDVKFEAKLAPPFIDDGEYMYYRLEEMGGRLCSLKITCENQKLIEIWRLEDHDRWAWSKVHSINWMEIHPSDIELVEPLDIVGLIASENKLLFTLYMQREDPSNCYVEPIYCYDLLAKTFSKYSDDISLVLQVHAESLLSPTKVLAGWY